MRIQKANSTSSRVLSRRIQGQGMTEYIIVVALVAIAAVAAVSFFGAAVKGQFVQLGGELLGKPDVTGIKAADDAGKAAAKVKAASTLGNYGQ